MEHNTTNNRVFSDLERSIQEENMGGRRKVIDNTTDWYFRPKSFEREGSLYEILGVRYIKKICELIGKIHGKNPRHKNNYRIWSKTKKGLKEFDYQTRFNEATHLFFMSCSGICAFDQFTTDDFVRGGLNAGLTILNAYCIMLQRYNRGRLYNVIDRKR